MTQSFRDTFTFDDVLLVPQKSGILPKDTILKTNLTKDIVLNLPFMSAPMDTVTEHKMAVAMALAGGIGIIHKNLSVVDQVEEVVKVKRFKNSFIYDPITVGPDDKISKVAEIRDEKGYKKIPVVDNKGLLVGLITDVDYFMPDDAGKKVADCMRPVEKMVTGKAGISLSEANKIIRERHLNTLCLVGDKGSLAAIVTRRDMEKNEQYPNACKNIAKQLCVGAAVGVGMAGWERAQALIKIGTDVIVIDTAHGHSAGVINMVKQIKKKYKNQPVIAGNIATAAAARDLVIAGADAVKVGIGPGSICTTRIISGVGVPQLSAIREVVGAIKATRKPVKVIADGGIKNSGDITKALAMGASAVMMGNMFAGTDESPGRVEFIDGHMYKIYRGMGSLEAMQLGSKDRYGQGDTAEKNKLVPEGVSGRVHYKGTVERILYQLAGGLRSGMGYCGSKTIAELQKKAEFVRISPTSLHENHPHDLLSIDAAPNYNAE